MKLAVNYSYPLIHLLEEGKIQVDLIKCPDWEGMLKEAQACGDVTIHFDMDAGLGETFNVDFSRIKDLLRQTSTPHVNTHIVTPRHFDPDNKGELQKINTLWRDEIQYMIDHLGSHRIAVEHHPYTLASPNLREAARAETFSQVLLDTQSQLLLDLSHARITAHTFGMDVKDYVKMLPLDRLVELHITGVKPFAGVLTDHFEMMAEDWEIFAWALGEIKTGNWREPEIVAFEYGGVGNSFVWRTDKDMLEKQVPLLYEMVHGQV